jgi:DNA-damage-inducible protein D
MPKWYLFILSRIQQYFDMISIPTCRRASVDEMTVFHFEDESESFEDLGKSNGIRYWLEADLQKVLGYETSQGFRNTITRAMQACLSLGIATEEIFILSDGSYKLTRFACYLIAMNGDNKKPQVAKAQIYFAALAETFERHQDHCESIDRILIRREMADGMKSIASTASRHGVENYAFFLNAGYRGMYNMTLAKLTTVKGAGSKECLLDRMGKVELAGNLFRITQTDAKIKNEDLQGQKKLEKAAEDVGRTVRKTMMELSGTPPEKLPLSEPIKDVKKKLKEANKKFKQLDGKKKDKSEDDSEMEENEDQS